MIEDIGMGKKTGKGNTPLVAFRMPPELVARLDRHADRMSKATPGLTFTRTDAIRSLLTKALDDVETKRSRSGDR